MKPQLRVVRLRLPGQWSDGWLYKEHLILWSRNGTMHIASLDDLAQAVRDQASPGVAVAADYGIFRNDWKASEQFRRISSLSGVRDSIFQDFPSNETPATVIVKSFSPSVVASDAVPGFLLDVAIYANRIYMGSTDGLFESRFFPDEPEQRNPLVQRLGDKVTAVNAKYSAVNSSAEEHGLWFAHVNFGEERWWSQDLRLIRTAEVSRDNSFVSFHLLNYRDDEFPTFLRARTVREKPHERAEFQESRILSYQEPTDIRGITTAAIASSRRVALTDNFALPTAYENGPAQVLGNSTYRLLIGWRDSVQVVDISAYPGKQIAARPDPAYRKQELNIDPSSILKTYSIGGGFLVELIDEIRLIMPRGSYPLIKASAARIRTFVHARRYQDTALVVEEDGASLIGFFEFV
jgi:hypothetical protein